MEQQGFHRFGPGYQAMDDVHQATRRLAFQHPRALGTVAGLQAQFALEHVERAGHRMDLPVQAFVGGQAQALHGELRLAEGIAEVERAVPGAAAAQQGFAVRTGCGREVAAGWEHMHVAGTKVHRASCACRYFSSVKPAFTACSTAASARRQRAIKGAVGSSQAAASSFSLGVSADNAARYAPYGFPMRGDAFSSLADEPHGYPLGQPDAVLRLVE